jgi:Uma2 family endonuclease
MAMATNHEVAPRALDERFVIRGFSWEKYQKLLEALADCPVRVTYDRGEVELMSPSISHEKYKTLLGIFLQALVEELEIPCVGLGSATWKRRDIDRGLEADECFYLAHTEEIKTRTEIDLTVDPPPDLAVEIEITSSSMNREPIYAALGVPEIWRFDGDFISVWLLDANRSYREAARSPTFPYLPLREVSRRVQEGAVMDQSRWGREVRAWLRREVVPMFRAEGQDRSDDISDG